MSEEFKKTETCSGWPSQGSGRRVYYTIEARALQRQEGARMQNKSTGPRDGSKMLADGEVHGCRETEPRK